jgi:hypothetical protein
MGNPGYQANLSISPNYGNMSDSINLRSAYTYTVSVSDELNAYNNGWLTEEEALSEINNTINNFINNVKNLYYTVTVAYSYGDIY